MFGRARLRLTLWYTAVMGAVLVAVGLGAYLFLRQELDDEIDDSLATAAAEVSRRPDWELRGEGNERHGGPPPGNYPDERTYSTDVFYFTLGPEGKSLWNPANVDTSGFPLATLAEGGDGELVSFNAAGEHYRALLTEVAQGPGEDGAMLLVGRSLESRDYQLQVLAIVLTLGSLAGLGLAAGGGYWLAGRALAPIRSSLETQRRFVSDASHELRTPISVMKANAELLLRHPDQSVEANIDQVAAINEESDHLTRLVGDLLTLARADEQRLELARERVDLDELLEGIVRDMGVVAEQKGICLDVRSVAGAIEADSQRIRQLVVILLDNALKFTPRGGSVSVRGARDGSRVSVRVSDTGPGIDAAEQARIFDRFYRSDAARAPESGTGLGLAIARSIAEAHGGRITVESKAGEGATFEVRLPLR